MTFEVPKILNKEFQFFAQKMPSNVGGKPISFGSLSKGTETGKSSLSQELNEISSYGHNKTDDGPTRGLCGAPTPSFGCGENIWTYC